jgi:hypothetical protein
MSGSRVAGAMVWCQSPLGVIVARRNREHKSLIEKLKHEFSTDHIRSIADFLQPGSINLRPTILR